MLYLNRPEEMVVIAVEPPPTASPKSGPAATNYNLYILSSSKDIPQALYIFKLQCNEEEPLNDIPKRKGATYLRCRAFSFYIPGTKRPYFCSILRIFSFRRAVAFLQSSSTMLFSPTTFVSVPSALLLISTIPSR